jgi:exopolyphosphatase/guanosine-5'-triphosphate,3'-diphosphate pyrophosphatase
MKFAVIDIGSNAIRMQISGAWQQDTQIMLKKLEYLRFPLRLGREVFEAGIISEPLQEKFLKLMKAFQIMIDLYEVDEYIAVATSAMRDAKNSAEIIERTRKEVGLDIKIISGADEAAYIDKVIYQYVQGSDNYIHIDVGGGSTEINIYKAGEKIASESFNAGSVRNTKQPWTVFEQMDHWLQTILSQGIHPIKAIGTGGNIGKVFELHKQNKPKSSSVSYTNFLEIFQMLQEFTNEERQTKLMLNPDRADVIVPACQIYLHVMRIAHASKIEVPDVGLKDGMLLHLVEKNMGKGGFQTTSNW